jgi:hypothetical protein
MPLLRDQKRRRDRIAFIGVTRSRAWMRLASRNSTRETDQHEHYRQWQGETRAAARRRRASRQLRCAHAAPA